MNKNFLRLSILLLAIILISLLFKNNNKECFTFERPTPDAEGKCQVNGVEKPIWWSQGSVCYQSCPSKSQTRDSSGRCYCNQGGNNETCHSSLVCKDNVCQENIQETTMAPTTTMAPVEGEPTISTTTTYLEDNVDNSPFSLKNMSGSNMDNNIFDNVDGSATKIQKTFSALNGVPLNDNVSIKQSNIPMGTEQGQNMFSRLMDRKGEIDVDLINNPTDIDLKVGYNNH